MFTESRIWLYAFMFLASTKCSRVCACVYVFLGSRLCSWVRGELRPDIIEVDDLEGVIKPMMYSTADLQDPPWILLPGADESKSSEIRLRAAEPGKGLMFFPWGNFRQLQRSDRPELTLEFRHDRRAGFHAFILEPGDIFIRCPQKYPWPFCFVCRKFLFPHKDHRCSWQHMKWWRRLGAVKTTQDVVQIYRDYAPTVLQRHAFGEGFRG